MARTLLIDTDGGSDDVVALIGRQLDGARVNYGQRVMWARRKRVVDRCSQLAARAHQDRMVGDPLANPAQKKV